ncbi:MAG: NAD(P)H-binding protein [Myxococcota bacterium]
MTDSDPVGPVEGEAQTTPSSPQPQPLRVAVAGATGFVGRSLVPVLAESHEVVALGRGISDEDASAERSDAPKVGVTWRRCDLFSLYETERALEGVDVAYYLVHSMMPSSRLTQGDFKDLDLLLADNFGRAAANAGVRRIIYLGGLVPTTERSRLSRHLASRLEAERVLGGYGVPVTAMRAGLVVGRGGSSLDILVRLVGRLPMMICPSWTGSRTQPIALEDAVGLLAACLTLEESTGRVCEVGGPDVLTYREMMRETARVMGKRRVMLPVPLVTPGLSRLWVSLVTGSPKALVAPLIQSLRHPMVAEDPWLQARLGWEGKTFADALDESLRPESLVREPMALSVQRMPLPRGRDAIWLAAEFAAWLATVFRGLIRVERSATGLTFRVVGLPWPLLELRFRPDRSGANRALFAVEGGLLAGTAIGFPRLEFRTVPEGGEGIAAVHQFSPRLPWWLYRQTQARAHAWVMWRFGRHLDDVREGASPVSTIADRKAWEASAAA